MTEPTREQIRRDLMNHDKGRLTTIAAYCIGWRAARRRLRLPSAPAPAGDLADAIAERDANSLLACAYGKQMVKLEAERDALRADAARYRWLRDVGDEHWTALTVRASKGATQIDAAIDAAREPK